MSFDNISNDDFLNILKQIIESEPDPEFSEDNLIKTINDELAKSYLMRDYPLIHECCLSLSEIYGYEYNNEFEDMSEKQIKRTKTIHDITKLLTKARTAMF